ncbi:methyltransferase [Skermania sp. ID1734]|uniref:class I SAM-dependent methyltransferase n=1 Tax=Skermania sp. ID1734 TaxID=2597516 RepID=UPI0011813A52|nr:class I SAM-dependent methyltransferase [Skermania sp. ID1734]TSE02005.1 methyltransferase [Skermania sp. ID1734]
MGAVSTEELLADLRRHPDIEAPNLFAVDAADRLILDSAAEAIAPGAADVAVLNDNYGALTLGAAYRFGLPSLRVYQDLATSEQALDANAARLGLGERYRRCRLDADLLDGASVVLVRLPRSLAQLAEIAETVARYAPEAVIYAGGRDKHMSPAMNAVLAECFADVQAGRGRQKSRVIVARGAKPVGKSSFPEVAELTDLGIVVAAHGGAFRGAGLDIGTRFLLGFLSRMHPEARDVIDLGCGTGILATKLALSRPHASIAAYDNSRAAVVSTSATAARNDAEIDAVHANLLDGRPDASVDLIVCNPPFHVGATVHTGAALAMFSAARRVLRTGGELWTVFNRHLNYRRVLAETVGPTTVIGRNGKFTVTRSVR